MKPSASAKWAVTLCVALAAGPAAARDPQQEEYGLFGVTGQDARVSRLELALHTRSAMAPGVGARGSALLSAAALAADPAQPPPVGPTAPSTADLVPGEEKQAVSEESAEERGPDSLNEINKQLSNPVTSLWALSFQFNNYYLENDRWNSNLQFQPLLPVSLTADWNLITRPVIQCYNSVPYFTDAYGYERTTAFGDMILMEQLSPAKSGPWLLGVGPTFVFPTATSKYTGQGKWQAGPSVVVGYLAEHFILGAFPQQWWSFAGDSDRPGTSQLNLQPFAAVFFSAGWSIGYSGNILANWKAGGGDVWTVPLGLGIGRVVKLGPLPVKFQVAGQWMVVHPEDTGQEWNIQVQITPVIPKLVKNVLFD